MDSTTTTRQQRRPLITTSSTSNSDSLYSSYSYETQSTAPTSFHSAKTAPRIPPQQQQQACRRRQAMTAESISSSSSSSVATYDSNLSDMEPLQREDVLDHDDADSVHQDDDDDDEEEDDEDNYRLSDPSDLNIPPVLPPYRGSSSMTEVPVRPSSPGDFARLFPSLDRLAVRHDDLTPDGNMNLRVDVVVPGRRSVAVQLFHLRMHDLARREFSLRRYCRDSGREVCNSKRAYAEAPSATRPALRRSMSSAIQSVKAPFHRANTSSSVHTSKNHHRNSSDTTAASSLRRGSLGASSADKAAPTTPAATAKPVLVPTNSIKLEFSNYARVDVKRMGDGNGNGGSTKSAKGYEFEWWGHRYTWKRVVDKNLDNNVSFHLVRDGHGAPVAHIVPEVRSPNQVYADEISGAWVTPCYMWISDPNIIDAVTDVADVVISTGLIALVDDCIKERWQKKPKNAAKRPMTSRSHDYDAISSSSSSPRTIMQSLFQRRHSDHHGGSTVRFGRRPVAAY